MSDHTDKHTLPALITGDDGRTVWAQRDWPIEARGEMLLSPRIGCTSLRLRKSEPGYTADWHVAGDPTLIIVRIGTLRLILRDSTTRDFGPGEAFIAADAVPEGEDFNPVHHGHQAEVVGDAALEAIHIKLA